jgi:hypothetical protein
MPQKARPQKAPRRPCAAALALLPAPAGASTSSSSQVLLQTLLPRMESRGSGVRLEQLTAHLGTAATLRESPGTAAAPSASSAWRVAEAQRRPNGYGTDTRIHDLLITNGRVVDPANGIDAVLDVAVRWGKISAVGEHLDPALAAFVFDATGLVVAPGLIDSHVHCFTACTTLGVPADEYEL